jgi:putative flippase GtrA
MKKLFTFFRDIIGQYSGRISDLNIQIIKFTIIGVTAVFVDLGCYFTFLHILPEKLLFFSSNEATAKTLSFLCGLSVTYFANKYWTWKERGRSGKRLMKFAALYGISLVVNVSVNSFLLYILHRFQIFQALPSKYLIAFTGATGLSAVMNFIGQKFWVFQPRKATAAI